MPDINISLLDALELTTRALIFSRTSDDNARATASALVDAERDGQIGHGLSRVPSYAAQSRSGKVNGFAVPKLSQVLPAVARIDADFGFSYPAIALGLDDLVRRARNQGIAIVAIHRSHHFGQAGAHAERIASHGLIGLAFTNSPKALAFWGGHVPRLGTNPIAFACPMPAGEPLVIDTALAVAARGKILAMEQRGQPIPGDWAVDNKGNPTTDPGAALKGAMLAIGGPKGSALALMVELLAAALTGGSFGWQASSVLDDQGPPPNLGHILIAIEPRALSGGDFLSRMTELEAIVAEEPNVRLPGTRRIAHRRRSQAEGIWIDTQLFDQISALSHSAG